AQAAAATRSNAPAAMANRGGVPVQGTTPQRPFPALNAQQQQYLQSILAQWESKSQETKTMTCNFQRFYYKPIQAKGSKNGVWSVATGEIRYAAPDNGYFFVKDMVFFSGVEAGGKPKYAANPNDVGEYWVCTGDTLKSFDRVKKVCKVLQVPPQLRGQNIFESPLPFVFNLDAQRMQQRYWIQPLPPPANNPNVIMVKAYPKRQADRGMYKWVQFAVDKRTFNPLELILADPNYDEKTAPNVQLYKFTDFKRNALLDKFAQWRNQFIQIMPPKDWQVVTNTVPAPAPQSAAAPGGAVPGGSAPGGTTQRR
ncbi:MAG: TIGR03009 domain-containing protein, partial [Planctomycetota bacterium]